MLFLHLFLLFKIKEDTWVSSEHQLCDVENVCFHRCYRG